MSKLLESITGMSLRLGRSLQAPRPLQVTQDDPLRLAIESSRGRFVVDHRHRTLSRNGRVLARFMDIRSVNVQPERTDGVSGHWTISVQVGPKSRVRIGDTDDEVHASMVAARISAAVISRSPARSRTLMSGS